MRYFTAGQTGPRPTSVPAALSLSSRLWQPQPAGWRDQGPTAAVVFTSDYRDASILCTGFRFISCAGRQVAIHPSILPSEPRYRGLPQKLKRSTYGLRRREAQTAGEVPLRAPQARTQADKVRFAQPMSWPGRSGCRQSSVRREAWSLPLERKEVRTGYLGGVGLRKPTPDASARQAQTAGCCHCILARWLPVLGRPPHPGGLGRHCTGVG